MLRSRIQPSIVGLVLVVAASWGVACSDKDSGEDTNNSGSEATDETSESGESSDTELQSGTSEAEEQTPSGDGDSSEMGGMSADDGSTDGQTTDEPPPEPPSEITPEAIEAACARVEQCDQPDAGSAAADPDAGSCTAGVDAGGCAEPQAGTCSEEIGGAATLLGAVCPSAFGAYLECLAGMEGCDPEVDCAEEGAAFEACEPESMPMSMLSEELVEMACANSAECDPEEADPGCIEQITFAAALVETACPGAFVPFVTCLAETTECDTDTACAEEIAALQECGIDPTM